MESTKAKLADLICKVANAIESVLPPEHVVPLEEGEEVTGIFLYMVTRDANGKAFREKKMCLGELQHKAVLDYLIECVAASSIAILKNKPVVSADEYREVESKLEEMDNERKVAG